MLSIHFWAILIIIIINAWSLSEFVGFCLSTRLLRIDHKFSMGLRSGEFPGHGPKISMFCSPSHLVIPFALWQGAPSCSKRHCSSPNCFWIVGRSCSWRKHLYLCHFQNLWSRLYIVSLFECCVLFCSVFFCFVCFLKHM